MASFFAWMGNSQRNTFLFGGGGLFLGTRQFLACLLACDVAALRGVTLRTGVGGGGGRLPNSHPSARSNVRAVVVVVVWGGGGGGVSSYVLGEGVQVQE